MHSLGEQSTRRIQSSYREKSFRHLTHFHAGARLLLICTLNSPLSNFKHPTNGVLTTLPGDSASDKTGPFHNNQQKIFLVKMSAYYHGQTKEYKDQICGKRWGEEGDDNISSITGGGAACTNEAPFGILAKCTGGCRAGVSGGSFPLFEGLSGDWVISAAEKRTQHCYFCSGSSDLQWQGKRMEAAW